MHTGLCFSMEECEALCNRLAIMVGGQFVCMGGIQYLKQIYGQGFTIMVKLRAVEADKPTIRRLKREIKGNFSSGCVLKDEHQVSMSIIQTFYIWYSHILYGFYI